MPMESSSAQIAMRVSRSTILINFLLSVLKMFAGLLAHSGAMVSDAIHSASDVFSTLVVIIGMKAAGKASDRDHPYGHERMECVAAIVLSVILLITGLFVGYEGLQKIRSAGQTELTVPGTLALIAAVISIFVKECMYQYTRKAALKIQSDALLADAWHHRSDAFSSIGALVGIAGAQLGVPVMDPIASLVICVMIGKAAYDIFRSAINKMVDQSCDQETENKIREFTLHHDGVKKIDLLMTRQFGNRIYIEMEISADGDLPLKDAHAIAEKVHTDIETAFPQVKHIMIHVNPDDEASSSVDHP